MNIFVKYILLLSFFTLISCLEDNSITTDDLDISQWNDFTINFVIDECNLRKNEYNQKGMPITVDSNKYKIGIEHDFNNFLKKRDVLFKNNFSFKSQEHIIIEEIYDRGQIMSDIKSSFSLNKGSETYNYFINSSDEIKERKITYNDFDEYKEYANINCVNQLAVGDLLDAVTIVTDISKNEKGEINYEIIYFSLSSTIH